MTKLNYKNLFQASLLMLSCVGSFAQALKEETRLLDKPSGVPVGAPVAIGTSVKIIERQGFWIRVEVSGRNGWMKASGLSFSNGGSKITTLDTGRLGSGNIVSTTATRGLSAKDLLNGAPRPEEVGKMTEFQPDQSSIKQFVAQGNLVALPSSPVLKASPTQSVNSAAQSSSTVGQSSNAAPAKFNAPKKDSDEW